MRYLRITTFVLAMSIIPAVSESGYPEISLAIDQFVSQVYPKGSRYVWVINDTTSSFSDEIIVDVNTELQGKAKEKSQPNRFLLLLVKGKLVGAQSIPLGAKVDCHSNEKEI